MAFIDKPCHSPLPFFWETEPCSGSILISRISLPERTSKQDNIFWTEMAAEGFLGDTSPFPKFLLDGTEWARNHFGADPVSGASTPALAGTTAKKRSLVWTRRGQGRGLTRGLKNGAGLETKLTQRKCSAFCLLLCVWLSTCGQHGTHSSSSHAEGRTEFRGQPPLEWPDAVQTSNLLKGKQTSVREGRSWITVT